jgi:hypothetical protein
MLNHTKNLFLKEINKNKTWLETLFSMGMTRDQIDKYIEEGKKLDASGK